MLADIGDTTAVILTNDPFDFTWPSQTGLGLADRNVPQLLSSHTDNNFYYQNTSDEETS